jgi:alpha-galactosidase
MLDLITAQSASVFVQFDEALPVHAAESGDHFTAKDAAVSVRRVDGATRVLLHCPTSPVQRVVLRWAHPAAPSADTLWLGDHWERGYGDLQWRTLQPERVMPWYVLAHSPRSGATSGAGVRVRGNAMACWCVDAGGVSLWLDVRNGGSPALLGDRELALADVVTGRSNEGESPLDFATRFCRVMCPDPRLPRRPVVGNNNWYYAYGENFNADTIRRDGAFLAELAGDHPNRPFCVIDAGWSPGSNCPGGPWVAGRSDAFPDLPRLADDLRRQGVLPGIWVRPTALSFVDDPKRLRPGPHPMAEKGLDLTIPENLAIIEQEVRRIRGWGYDLIKHDFSTFDVFGRWGFEFGADMTDAGWHFADRSLTNAEIINRLYATLRRAAGDDCVLLGCNTIGHLGAGLFEVQRTGDDTSGRVWERTRRMGINTLAFRLCQHNTFFATDADCAAHTARTPWAQDRQWLDLVARSGTPLFISVDPTTISPAQRNAFAQAIRISLDGGEAPGRVEPLDWMATTAPQHWRFGDREQVYDWSDPWGALPMRV